MKNNIFKASLIIPIIILLNIDKISYSSENSLIYELKVYFFGTDILENTGMFSIFFSLLPLVMIMLILYGTAIYKDLNISSIYLFTRQASRSKWYVRCTSKMFIYVLYGVFAFTSVCFAFAALGAEYTAISEILPVFLRLFIILLLFTYQIILLNNILCIFLGSLYAFFITYAVILIEIKTALLLMVSQANLFFIKVINPIFLLMSDIYYNIPIYQIIASGIIPVIFLLFAGLTIIKKADIGLTNRELY